MLILYFPLSYFALTGYKRMPEYHVMVLSGPCWLCEVRRTKCLAIIERCGLLV